MYLHSLYKGSLSGVTTGPAPPPASGTAWQPRGGCPAGQVSSAGRRSSELGTWWPASASLRSGSSRRGSRQKSSGCILRQTGTVWRRKARPGQNKTVQTITRAQTAGKRTLLPKKRRLDLCAIAATSYCKSATASLPVLYCGRPVWWPKWPSALWSHPLVLRHQELGLGDMTALQPAHLKPRNVFFFFF